MNCFKLKGKQLKKNEAIEPSNLKRWERDSEYFKEKLEEILFLEKYEDLFKEYKVFFVTMNPRINLKRWIKDITIMTKKYHKEHLVRKQKVKLFSAIFYNFEFKTKNPNLKLHSHSLIYVKKDKNGQNRIGKKWFFQDSGFYAPKIMSDASKVEVLHVNKETDHINRIRYIMGLKADKRKKQYVKADRRIRREYFNPPLKDYYLISNDGYQLKQYIKARIKEFKPELVEQLTFD